eukprot:1276269-Prymnesium_polylepis.1
MIAGKSPRAFFGSVPCTSARRHACRVRVGVPSEGGHLHVLGWVCRIRVGICNVRVGARMPYEGARLDVELVAAPSVAPEDVRRLALIDQLRAVVDKHQLAATRVGGDTRVLVCEAVRGVGSVRGW